MRINADWKINPKSGHGLSRINGELPHSSQNWASMGHRPTHSSLTAMSRKSPASRSPMSFMVAVPIRRPNSSS